VKFKVRPYQVLLSLVLIVSALIIGLRGTMPQSAATELDASNYVTKIEGVGLGGQIWSDNFTGTTWSMSVANNAGDSLRVDHSLNLTVTFQSGQVPQAISVSRNVNLFLDQNPTVVAELSVSTGVHYGIRFSGVTPGGATFDAWREGSILQHRPGLGTFENITANLAAETFLANDQTLVPGSRITRLWFYLEATPGTSGQFSLELSSLQALSVKTTMSSSSEISGNFYAIMIDMGLPVLNQTLFQAYAAYDVSGVSGFSYTPFLVSGVSVLAQGFTYTQTVSTHQVAVLVPQRVSGFPSVLPGQNTTALVIEANSGTISYFKLDDITLRYTATPDVALSGGLVDPSTAQWLIVYYLVFLFVTPVAAVILLTRVFKTEK